jgi:hypothetical protein
MDWDPDPVPDPACPFDADPDAYPDPDFFLCESGCESWSWFLFDAIQVTKLMWIHVDLDAGSDPQHTAYFMKKEGVVCDFLYEYIPIIFKYI